MAEETSTDESLAWKTRDEAMEERALRDKVPQLPLYWETGRTRLQKLRLKAINRGEDPDKIVLKNTAGQNPSELLDNNRDRVGKSRGRKNSTVSRRASTRSQKLRTQGTYTKKVIAKGRGNSNGSRNMRSKNKGKKNNNHDDDDGNQGHGYIGSKAYRDLDARLHGKNYARDNKLPYSNSCCSGLFLKQSAPVRLPEGSPSSGNIRPEEIPPRFSTMIEPLKEHIVTETLTETLPKLHPTKPRNVRVTRCSSSDEKRKEELKGNAQHLSKNTSLDTGGISSTEENRNSLQAPSLEYPSTDCNYQFPTSNERGDKSQVETCVEREGQVRNLKTSHTNTSIKTRSSSQKTSGQDDTHNHSNVFQQTGKGAKILPSGSKHIYHTSSPEKRNPLEAQEIPVREVQKIEQDADKRKVPLDKSSKSHDDHGIGLHGKRRHSPSSRSPDPLLIMSPERKRTMRAQRLAQKGNSVVGKTQDQSISAILATDNNDRKQTTAKIGAPGVAIDTASTVTLAKKEQRAATREGTEQANDEKKLKLKGKNIATE